MQEGADVRHSDQVVAAAVTDAREGVVLRDERDRGTGRTHTCAKSRLEPTDTHLHLMTMRREQSRYPCGGATLLICELGIGMDLAGQLHQLFGDRGGK